MNVCCPHQGGQIKTEVKKRPKQATNSELCQKWSYRCNTEAKSSDTASNLALLITKYQKTLITAETKYQIATATASTAARTKDAIKISLFLTLFFQINIVITLLSTNKLADKFTPPHPSLSNGYYLLLGLIFCTVLNTIFLPLVFNKNFISQHRSIYHRAECRPDRKSQLLYVTVEQNLLLTKILKSFPPAGVTTAILPQ